MTIEKLPRDLISAFSKDQAIFFVGAGLSIPAGFPTWDTLIHELITKGEDLERIPKEKIEEYKNLKQDPSKFLMLAEELKVDLGAAYSRYMEERFQHTDHNHTLNHEYIVKTKGNLVVTINYDDLLEKAYNHCYRKIPNVFIYSQSRESANNFWKSKFFILKAHGDANRDIETLILSQRDYRKTLYKETGYRSLLQTIFTSKSILFVGVSMNDPEFNQLLDYLHDSYHGGGPIHYLLIEKEKYMTTISKRFFDDFNIQTITFDNPNGDFTELTEILRLISEECPRLDMASESMTHINPPKN